MRVLVVDQDSALLTAITQLLGEYFTLDAVTTKSDCQDLLRYNEYDVIVAGERLEDGSGLELLSQMARSHPDTLRIFAAEPERLKLLKGRLGPFGLFRTLSYPIEPRQLVAALSAAVGTEEEEEEEKEQEEGAEAAAPQLQTPTRVSAVTAAVLGHKTPEHPRAPESVPERARTPAPAPTAPERPTSQARGAQRNRRGSTGRPERSARTGRPGGDRSRPERARQPTPEALALGARLSAAPRPKAKGFAPPSLAVSAQRSAVAVGASVALVVGALIFAFRIFSPPALHTANLSNTQAPSFPPEVLKLVADTETDFQLDDLKAARTDIAALQQIAPTHPGLAFFESELKRREAEAAAEKPPAPVSETPVPRRAALSRSNSQRPPEAATSPLRSKPSVTNTFSGTTLEDTSTATGRGASPGSSVIHEARIIQRVPAEYPEEAARNGIEGAVDVSFSISRRGEVYDAKVVRAEPANIFDRAAIAAVRRWKYQPRTIGGIPVEARVEVRLTFKLDGLRQR